MNKGDIISGVAQATGLSKAKCERVINASIEFVMAALAKGDSVMIKDFGVFESQDRAPRVARNPQTGEPIQVSATKRVTFRPGRLLQGVVKEENK